MRWFVILTLIPLVSQFGTTGATASSAPSLEASTRLASLGRLAAEHESFQMILRGGLEQEDDEGVHIDRPITRLLYWKKDGQHLRFDDINKHGVQVTLVNEEGATTWQRSGSTVLGAFRFERKRFAPDPDSIKLRLGTMGYFLDATQAYAAILQNYSVETSESRRGNGVEWFVLTPGTEASRELIGSKFEIAVDVETGLVTEYRATTRGDTVTMYIVSVDVGCPVGDALQMPSAVRASQIIDASTGLPLKKD